MHRPLVAASLIAVSVMVGYAAVPLGVSPRVPKPVATTEAPGPQSDQSAPATPGATRQAAAATVEGQVLDATGAAMPGAVVDAWHEASGWRALALTDREGRFRLSAVPAGSVTMTVRRGPIEFAQVIQVGTNVGRITLRDASARHGGQDQRGCSRGGALSAQLRFRRRRPRRIRGPWRASPYASAGR